MPFMTKRRISSKTRNTQISMPATIGTELNVEQYEVGTAVFEDGTHSVDIIAIGNLFANENSSLLLLLLFLLLLKYAILKL